MAQPSQALKIGKENISIFALSKKKVMEDKEKKKFNKKVVKEVAKSALKMGLTQKAAKKAASAAMKKVKGRDLSTPLAPSTFGK